MSKPFVITDASMSPLERRRIYCRRYEAKCKTDPRIKEVRRQNVLRKRATKNARARVRRANNREVALNYERQYRANNKDKIVAIRKRFRISHPGYSATSNRKHRAVNLELCRERERLWRKQNPENVRDRCMRRRARLVSATIEDCTDTIKRLKKITKCNWCPAVLTPKTVTIDHVIPLARGGKHCSSNLVAACGKCNYSRRDKLIHEWQKEAA